MGSASSLTPMFRQYHELKRKHPTAILLFRMGDFFEMFYEDAQLASRLLELTLTARGKGTSHVVPMCGFPHHQLDTYTARLVRADQRVAICEQVEDPRRAKGLVRREIVRLVSPGTLTDPEQLESKENSWLAAVAAHDRRVGAAFLDVSTGEFLGWESDADEEHPWHALAERLRAFGPKEAVRPDDLAPPPEGLSENLTGRILWTSTNSYPFTPAVAGEQLRRHFDVASLDGFGFRERPAGIAAAGGLLHYVRDTQKCGLEHVHELLLHEPSRYLVLDPSTRRNLELERSLRDGGRTGSLLHAVDATVTPAGGRLLRRRLLAPLIDVNEISRRQDAVEEFLVRPDLRRAVRQALDEVRDVERLTARTVAGTCGPRELLGLKVSLDHLPQLQRDLADARCPLLRELVDGLDPCLDVAKRLGEALVDQPPATLREGGVIRDGFHTELDEYRALRRDGRSYIASMERKERSATGIGSLKVKYNKVFGYFIEVSKPNLALVPEHYVRKQTISSGERFITPELKEYEAKVLHAQERIESLEVELFQSLRLEVAREAPRLRAAARASAQLDVFSALAELAAAHDYRRPVVDAGLELRLVAGRHPVVERALTDRTFVPNDTRLEAGGKALAVLTGPNMGGKSTYLRQVALIVLLAQTGSFVPVEDARIGIVDRIFCRVGASDSLAEGQSTFMVEMAETANILHRATARSLLLLDEIGRGTSTFDGLSIAWAIVERLHELEGGTPRTLFATHYHELTELAVELPGVMNLRMAVKEWGERVLFLHRVEQGAADRSYGIHVARLAGVPRRVIARAQEVLANLERDEYGADGRPRRAQRRGRSRRPRAAQPTLFTSSEPGEKGAATIDPRAAGVLAELRGQDLDRLTPLEALTLLTAWQRRLAGEFEPPEG